MKTAIKILPVVLLMSISNVFSQTVNDIPINELDVTYIQIVGTEKLLSSKVTIEIDFGQESSIWTNKDRQIKNKDGKLTEFNSMIDALNFFSSGYDFVNAYAITVSNQNVYHYLLKKKE